jgi:hypothetical protein
MNALIKINKWIKIRIITTANGQVKIKKIGQKIGTFAIVTVSGKVIASYEISIEKGLVPKVVRLERGVRHEG